MSAHESNGRALLKELLIRYREADLLDKERLEIEELLAKTSDKDRMLWKDSAAYRADGISSSTTDDALARLDAAYEDAFTHSTVPKWVKSLLFIATVIVLALVIWGAVNSVNEVPEGFYSASSESAASSDKPFILVSFNDTATIKEITDILHGVGLEISAGPLSGGVYRVAISAKSGSEYDAISATLEQNASVNWLVAGRRPAGD